jgi:type II secretory pathway component PulK
MEEHRLKGMMRRPGRIQADAPACPARGASVLVLTLWTLFFLGALAVAIGSTVAMHLRVAERLRADTAGWALAKGGINLAMAETAKCTNGWDAFCEPWADSENLFKDAALGTGTFRVYWEDRSEPASPRARYGVRDEDGKVNLRLAPTNLLISFFVEAGGGMSESAAARLADSVEEYRRTPSVLTGSAVPANDTRDKPSSGRFLSIYEARLVEGMTADMFARIAPYSTVFGDEKVNLNTADPLVLRSVAMAIGVSDKDAHALAGLIKDFRSKPVDNAFKQGAVESLWSLLPGAPGALYVPFTRLVSATKLSSTCFGGTAEGWVRGETGAVTRIEFVFERKSGAIRFWREE